MDLKYKRVLLKLSGEAFCDGSAGGIDFERVRDIAKLIDEIRASGAEIAIVNGAGNLFRGAKQGKGIDQEKADYIGMVATIMNSLSLQAILDEQGTESVTYCAWGIDGLIEKFDSRKAKEDLDRKKVVLSTAGTGKPFFTTDTAGVQRAVELECDLMIKASNVDGVYSDDPKKNHEAQKFEKIEYNEILKNDLKVLDRSAVEIAKEHGLKIIVTEFSRENILVALSGQPVGTEIS